jgi:uncharacterized protein (TIGR00730 family)
VADRAGRARPDAPPEGSLRSVCVFAGSNPGTRPAYLAAARELGGLLAARGIELVYGGASLGLMGAVADAALAGGGRVVGVIPEALVAREIAHRGLSELRVVATMHERKGLMAELADAFVALPGGLGTFEELLEVATWAQLGLHAKPVGLLDVTGFYQPLVGLIGHAVDEGFVRAAHAGLIVVDARAPELLEKLARFEPPPPTGKWVERDDL